MSCHYTGQASQFRGDQFLRFSPEESWLIERTEAIHGYDPHEAGRMPTPASPLPTAPITRVVVEGDSLPARQLLQLLEQILFREEEHDEEEYADEGEDEDDFDDDEEEEEEEDEDS